MDRRSWPWKKKSSDKSAAEKAIATLDAAGVSLASGGSQSDKDNYKKPNYVQISVESYEHLTGLEDQVKTYQEQVRTYEEQVKTYEDQLKTLDEQIDELNEKLSAAHTEMTNKEELVKQHAKVAEEAVSGWEKAEAEAATLKTHLEAVTISKLTAEDRAAHLDNALKECMRQIRNLKEEHEKKVQDVVLTKNLQYDKMKREFESKIGQLDQEILRAEAENAAVSRSLQERSSMLIKMTAEKSEAEAEIELLKSNIETCEREINSLKYEVHIVTKELEIRNEEKNMSAKTAEVANKQHMEGVKKIAKLEAECQRLRGLVKKKLPGPAALAQMKLEVESMGRDYGETRRRSPVKPGSPHLSPHPRTPPVTEFSLDGSQKLLKENEFLTERLLAMEEETKMLKEALAKRNSELQASRSMYARTANKLQSLEAQLHSYGKQKGCAELPSIQNASDPPSFTSLSEDGNDDAASVAESWASALISEVSHVKDKNKDKSSRTDSANHLELMDDFLEMEKLAGLSNDSTNVSVPLTGTMENKGLESVNQSEKQPQVNSLSEADNTTPDAEPSLMRKVQLRISKEFESMSNVADIGKILEEIKRIVQETIDTLHPHPVSCVFVEKHCSEDAVVTSSDKQGSLLEIDAVGTQNEKLPGRELEAAISEIHTFVLSLGKQAAACQGKTDDEDCLNRKIELLSAACDKVLCNEDMNLTDIVVSLSNVLVKVGHISFNLMGYKSCEMEANTPDCIDKVALPENKDAQEERFSNGCSHVSDSSSNPEFPEANILPGLGAAAACKYSLEEFEQMKVEKNNTELELARSMEDLESTKSQLKETEQNLAEVKSQLVSAQKTNSLSETQLKCMAESYKSLEKRAEELETEVNLLQSKMESLEIELQAEKVAHEDALTQCKDLEEQLQRNEECAMCSSLAADLENKSKQEKELAAAAEKLAECQETIFLLGRQLKGLRPPQNERDNEGPPEEEPATSGMNGLDLMDQAEMGPAHFQNMGNESPVDLLHTESNGIERAAANLTTPKHRPTKSGSSSASSTPTPEKHARGFSRFFSSKGNNHRH